LVLTGGVFLSSTGVYTAIAATEDPYTSEYTSALEESTVPATGTIVNEVETTVPQATETVVVPETMPPTTQAPTTQAPTTQAPTTQAPTTQAPTTQAPTTQAPTTQAPTTQAPTTQAPTTQAPTTQAPTTQASTTQAPTTQAPTTQAPVTRPPVDEDLEWLETTEPDETTTSAPETGKPKPDFEVNTQQNANNTANAWVGVDGTTANMGTESNPYAVSSVEFFLAMSELINDTGNANKYFKLTADIDFSTTTIDQTLLGNLAEHHGIGGTLVSVKPEVSSESNVFFHLDGNNKKITNVTMNLNSFNSLSIFGYVNSASTITNLTVSKVNITNGYSDAQAAGIILKNEGTVKDCMFTEIVLDTTVSTKKAESFYPDYVTLRTYSGTAIVVDNSGVIDSETKYDLGSLTVTAENVTVRTSRPYAGSMVAQNRGKINKVRVRNITVHGNVTESDYVGGLVGSNATQRTSSSTGMYYCEIQLHNDSLGVKGADKVGYLVGYNTGRIQYANVTGRFKTNEKASSTKYDLLVTGESAAGGIVGDNTGDVQLCTATNVGVYFADETDGAIYGGIAGKSTYSIRNCIATGSTAGEGDASAITRYIGGIVGYGDEGNNFGVQNCYALVKIIDSKVPLGAIVGWGGDTAYKKNRVRNVFYSSIISSRPSPVSYGGAGESEGDLTFTKPYTVATRSDIIRREVNVSTSAFGFSGWGTAEISTIGSVFSGTQNDSYYTLSGLGTSEITYVLIDNAKNDRTTVYYNVDITIPSSAGIGANKDGTLLEDQPMELGILNSLNSQNGYTSDGFVGTKDNPIVLGPSDINMLYYAPAAHFTAKDANSNLVANDTNFTAPSATFWGTIDLKGGKIELSCNKGLFKGIYGSRDDSLQNNDDTIHKSDPGYDQESSPENLANGVIRNLTVEIELPNGSTDYKREISTVFGNVCNATMRDTNVTFNSAIEIWPQEENTGLFAKAIYGNSYLYACYVDSNYVNGMQSSSIHTSHDGVSGFVGVIDAEKAIIDNCGADIPIFPEKQSMQNIGIFVGEIKSLEGGYIQNCYASGALVKTGGSFQASSCNLFAGKISSDSDETKIYNCYYSPSYMYTNGVYKDGIMTGIKAGSFTGSCKIWSFQMQNASTQLWGDISVKVSAAEDKLYLESISNIDRYSIESYDTLTGDLNTHFTATSSNEIVLDPGSFYWDNQCRKVYVRTTFSGDKNASASITARHNATGLAAKLTVFNSSDLETVDGYYIIETPAELYYLSANQTKLISGSTEYMYMSSESKIRLAADIDMSGYTIEPIGNGKNHFKGEFDGAGYTISNLNFGPDNLDHALFGYVQGATIKNLTIDNANIEGTSYTGAIVGTVYDYANINSCKVTNSVISGQNHVGGIVGGINAKSGAQATQIINCTVENTTVTSTKNANEHGYVGGIIGGTSMNGDDGCYAEITGCKVIDSTIESKAYGAGGVVGYAPDTNNKISSCEVTGTTVTSGNASNGITHASLGAVAGAFGGATLENCTVTSCTITGECASGVVGRLINEAGTTSTISGCTVTDSIITAPDIAGGILAQVSAYATSSCWGDKVVENCKVSADTTVKALVAGGIVGNVQQFSDKNLTVSGCTNLGTIETTGRKGSITDAAGGIVGRLQSGLQTPGILITVCLSQGTLKGNSNLGGIIGMNNANAHTGANKLIKDCYVTTEFESSNLAVVKGLAIGYVGAAKSSSANLADNVVYSSLNTREVLFGNIEPAQQTGGFDMNKGADQTKGGITVDFAKINTNLYANRLPYYANAIMNYGEGEMMGETNVIELKTNYYVNKSGYDGYTTKLSCKYGGLTYTLRQNAAALTQLTVPHFSVGNLPVLMGTDGTEFSYPAGTPDDPIFTTTASKSKILVGFSTSGRDAEGNVTGEPSISVDSKTNKVNYNQLTDVSIQTFDRKCEATVKTTYTGIINGETVKFDVGFKVVVNGEHKFDYDGVGDPGTANNPFYIYTAEDLLAIKQHHDNPSENDIYKDNPDFYYEAYYEVMNDIDMTEELDSRSFAPIGTADEPFKGTITTKANSETGLNEHYKISGLVINNPSANDDYAYNNSYTPSGGTPEYSDALGLFGYTDGATISNIELENVNILSVPGSANSFLGTKSGALVGVAENTTIENVKVTGISSVAIEGSFGGRAGAVGGIVGWAGDNVVMKDVSVIGVNNDDRSMVKGQYCVGGIVGLASNATGCSITNAVVQYVNVIDLASSGVSIAGGIAGQYSGIITGSTENRIKVDNVSVTGTVVGGVVGSGNVSNESNLKHGLTLELIDVTNTNVEVTDTVRADPNAGPNGIAGGILGQSCDSYQYYITDCTVDEASAVTSGYCAGGIVGHASNRGVGEKESCLIISNCKASATIKQLNAANKGSLDKGGTIDSKTGAGAVIGVIASGSLVMNEDTKAPQIQIKNVTAGGEIAGTCNVGGIIGKFAVYQLHLNELNQPIIHDCIVTVKIGPVLDEEGKDVLGATDRFGVIIGSVDGNTKNSNSVTGVEPNRLTPFPEYDTDGNVVEYSVRPFDKIFYSSYTAGNYDLYGISEIKNYQDSVRDVFFNTIYDVNNVVHNYVQPDKTTVQIPVGIVKDGTIDPENPSATYQLFGNKKVYAFSEDFMAILDANDGFGTPYGFTIAGEDFELVETDGVQSSDKGIFEVVPNPYGGSNPYKIQVNKYDAADLVFTYTNGLQIAIPIICGVKVDGSGTVDKPFKVPDADTLALMVPILSSYDTYFVQTADINMEKANFPIMEIGDFGGCIYDGGGHSITGYNISVDSSTIPYGIFGKVSGVRYKVDNNGNQVLDENGNPIIIPNIQNVTFIDCSVNSGNCEAGTGIAIGELADGATVSNIKVTGGENNSSSATSKLGNVGGAIGTVTGASTVNGVTVENTTVSTEKGSAGGAIGTVVNDTAVINSPVVKNTTVTSGSVNTDGTYLGGTTEDIAGGIVAQARGTITGPAATTDEDGNPVYVNAVEGVTVRALIAGGAVGAVYKTNQGEAEDVTHELTLKDIRVSGVEVTAKSADGTRATSGAGLLGFARAKTEVTLDNCYVNNITKDENTTEDKSSLITSQGGVSYGAGAVANVDENVIKLELIDVESYAEVNAVEARSDGDSVVYAASLVAYINNAPTILTFNGCVAGGEITGHAMNTFVGGAIGGFNVDDNPENDAEEGNTENHNIDIEITDALFINGVISAELECIDGTTPSTNKAIHRRGKFIARYGVNMFKEENFSTMFSNNYYSTYPQDIAFFATETGSSTIDSWIGDEQFKDVNKDNLKIGSGSDWNDVAIISDDGTPAKLYVKFSSEFAEIKYGSQYGISENCKKSSASGGLVFEGVTDASGNPIFTGPDDVTLLDVNPEDDTVISFEVSAGAPAAETLIAEYTCGLKTTAQIISVEIFGTGTESDPFLIENPTQLRIVAYLANSGKYFRQIKDINLEGSYNEQSAENQTNTDAWIHYNSGNFYAPIGTDSSPFNGVYDGQGYKITGVKSNRENQDDVGVFGVVKPNSAGEALVPTIKNLHVELMAPDQKANGILGDENVGGIAGRIENSVIENCSVTVGTVTGKQNVGGIVGNFTSSQIINCFTQSDVNAINSEVAPYAGGIVGYVTDAVNFNSTISGCFASGSIYASTKDTTGNDRSNAAGIVAYLENSTNLVVNNCLFTGTTSSGYGIVGKQGYTNFKMTISNCIDAGQNVAMENDKFVKIPTAVASSTTLGTGTITKSNLYYDSALLKVNTDVDEAGKEILGKITGKPTSELITTNVMADVKDENGNNLWQKIDGHYPVPVVSQIDIVTYARDDKGNVVTEIVEDDKGNEKEIPVVSATSKDQIDLYSDAYAKFLSAPIQTSETEEESDIKKVAYGQGLVYPVTLLTNVDGNKVTYSSSIFDTTDTVSYDSDDLKAFDTKLYGAPKVDEQGKPILNEDGTYPVDENGAIISNKNVDLLFGDDAEKGKTTVYRNIFDTTKGIAERGNFETKPTKNTFVNAGAASGGVFSNKEAYYNAQVPVVFATATINGVEVQRDIKIPLSYGTTYCIATQRQLYALGKAEYELATGTKFSKYYGSTYNYKLITDIDCGDNTTLFTPIGLYETGTDGNGEGYTGQFDGSGHTIKNLKIKQTGKDFVGMFAMVSKAMSGPNVAYGACVKNLTLETPTVEAISETSGGQQKGGNYVGALVGYVKGSGDIVIENCHVIGNVEYKVDEKGETVFDENDNPIVEAYHGEVRGDGSYVGGLIGRVQYPSTVIRSCSSSVFVSGSRDAVGGLIGNSGATITSCYATGNVVCDYIYNNSNETKLYGVGGLIGIMSDGTVSQSFASGNVEVKAFTEGNNRFVDGTLGIGGFVGVLDEVNTYDSESKEFVPFEGDAITECFSGGNVKFGTINETSAIRPYLSTAIVGIGGFSGVNKEGIAHVYSSAAVNATFADITARNADASYGVGIGGVAGVALGNVQDVYSSGSVAPAYSSIDSTENPNNCYFGKGGTVGTKMNSGATVMYCYYDSWTNTDPTLTSIGGQANNQEARGLTTLELTSGKKPANTNFSDAWGFTPNAYPYLIKLLKEDSDDYIKTNSILSVVCVNVAYDDVSAKTGAGITQALTVPSEFKYTDENKEHVYKLDWAGATLSGNLAAIRRTRNTREYVDVVAQIVGYEQYATRVYSRLCADMKGTFEQPYLIGSEDDLDHMNMTADELAAAKETFTGFYDQWATPLGEGNEQVEGTVYYQLMSNIEVDETVRPIPDAPDSYTYSVTVSDAEGNSTTENKTFNYKGFVLKGNGYSIKNVNTTDYYFDTIDKDSIISNVIFENFTFTGNNSAVVGTNKGLLQDVYVKATIGDGTADISNAAGLVDTNDVSDSQMVVYENEDGKLVEKPVYDHNGKPVMCGTIDGCMVDATIKGALSNVGVMAVTNNGTIKNSGTAGTLDTSTTDTTISGIGAFVVSNNKTVEDSFSMADVNVLAEENATVNHVSGFAAINEGTMDGVYTRSAISFANTPADTLTVGSLVGEITNKTEAEPVTNSYAAGLLGYFNPAQDSILFGKVPPEMNKLSSVYVDKSLAGQASKDSFKYSASLSSIMSMNYMPDAMKYEATNNPNGAFVAGDAAELTLPQLSAIKNAENHQVVDAEGNLIYVDISKTDKVVTYTIFTETVEVEVEGDGEDGNIKTETVSVRKYRCSEVDENGENIIYLADGSDNVWKDVNNNNKVDDGVDEMVVPVENLKLQYAIYLEGKTIIRNYDVIKAYSQISSMTIKTSQSQYADFLAPSSSDINLYDGVDINSSISKTDGVNFNPTTNIVGINNGTNALSTGDRGGFDTVKVNYEKAVKLSRGMEINPMLYIDVGVSKSLSKAQINPNFQNGMGTVNNPYVITSKESLTSLHYYGTESDLYFVLGDDIDMTGVEDFQIHHFTAKLNDPDSLTEEKKGQFAIQNFKSYKVNEDGTITAGHGGLFGTIEDGAVVNNIALTATINGDEQYTGALANIIRNATVTNCVVSANVTSTATADEYGNPATGILAGRVNDNAVISGIVTTGNVTVSAGAAGGVIGSAQDATISEVLSTANVGEGNTAGIVGDMGENATLANALYGGVAASGKPIVATNNAGENAITEVYYDNQTNKNIGEEDEVIGIGKSTKECEKLTFGKGENAKFKVVGQSGGYYPVPTTIAGTIGVGKESSHESYGSTAALAAATMNFYLGSTYGQIGYYTSMQFINTASCSAVTATEEGNGGYFSIDRGDKVYTIKTAKFNEELDPGISFGLENGAVRTVYPGLVRNANISYTIENPSNFDVSGKTLGVLFRGASSEKVSTDVVQVLNDFTNEIGVKQEVDALALSKDMDGICVGEMLPDGYKYNITADVIDAEGNVVYSIPQNDITTKENVYGTFVVVPNISDEQSGDTLTNLRFKLTIVKETDRPWGVNSVKNILW